jgi:hypothetical protein
MQLFFNTLKITENQLCKENEWNDDSI